MKKLFKYLALPLLVISLASCNDVETPSSEVPLQDNWLEEDLSTMSSVLGSGNIIPFSGLFVQEGNEYAVVEYSSVNKVAVECLLPTIQYDEEGHIFYNPLTDVDAYKDLCVESGFTLNNSLSNIDSHDFYLSKNVISTDNVDSEMWLNIYFTDANYLIADAWIETTLNVNVWPSRTNLNASYQGNDNLLSIAEMLGKSESDIFTPAITSYSSIVYRATLKNNNVYVSLLISTASSGDLDKFVADLGNASFAIDSSNSTAEQDDYYNNVTKLDCFIDKASTDVGGGIHSFKVTFIAY
ncbi:MAG: hypothetical protein VB015_00435 [Erysipelotrichaceae bacterium]|nr:hypothetical protein [Erysipelotrichaceae bacterium]